FLEDLDAAILLAVDGDRLGDVVPGDHAVLADEVARAPIGSLEVVEVDVRDRAVVEAQQDVSSVLGVDLEARNATGVREHLARSTEEPGQVVKLMDRVEDDAAARRLARAVALAVVGAGPPERQVVAAVGPRGERPSDSPLLDQPLHEHEARQEPEIAADEDRAAGPPGLYDERVRPLEGVRQGLLDEDVPAASECGPCLVEMAAGGRADDGALR